MLPVYSRAPDSLANEQPSFTGKYIDPGSQKKVQVSGPGSLPVRVDLHEPCVKIEGYAKETTSVKCWELSSGEGWVCDMHQAPHEIDQNDNNRTATGAGRAVLLSLVAPFERHAPFIKPLLMLEKLVAALIVVGVGSSSGVGTWLGVAFTFVCSCASFFVAPFISEAEDKMDSGQRTSTTIFTLLGALLQGNAFGAAAPKERTLEGLCSRKNSSRKAPTSTRSTKTGILQFGKRVRMQKTFLW